MSRHVALLTAFAVCIGGCATQRTMEWSRVRADAPELSQAAARCDYETSAATQSTDYSFRTSLGQELDRANRKRDLEVKCMLANGWVLSPAAPTRTPAQEQTARMFRELDIELKEAKAQRLTLRRTLAKERDGFKQAELSTGIASLNKKVSELEGRLGYVRSEPISTDPGTAMADTD